jgi:hypothetical protein
LTTGYANDALRRADQSRNLTLRPPADATLMQLDFRHMWAVALLVFVSVLRCTPIAVAGSALLASLAFTGRLG